MGILKDFFFGVGRAAKAIQKTAERLEEISQDNLIRATKWRDDALRHQEEVRNGTDGDFVGRHRKAAAEIREMIWELTANRGLALFFTELIDNRDELMNDRRPLKDIPFQFSPRELEELAEGFETAASRGIGAVELHRRHGWLKEIMGFARRALASKEKLDANPKASEFYYDHIGRTKAGDGGSTSGPSQK